MQIGEWLGFVINTIAMTFQIPEAKVRKLESLLSSAIRDKSSSYREIARIAGSLISVALAVGPLFTRQMYLAIESNVFIVLCGATKVEKSQGFRGQSGSCEDSFCRELQSPPPVSC